MNRFLHCEALHIAGASPQRDRGVGSGMAAEITGFAEFGDLKLGPLLDPQPAPVIHSCTAGQQCGQVNPPVLETLVSARPPTDCIPQAQSLLPLNFRAEMGIFQELLKKIASHKWPSNRKSIPASQQPQCAASTQCCCCLFLKAVLPSAVEKENIHCALGEMKRGSPVSTERSFASNSPSALLNVNLAHKASMIKRDSKEKATKC